MQSQQYV